MTGPPDPVGYQGEVRFVGRQHRHALASPSCEIGDHHVGFEVQLRLIEEEPAAGCSSTPTKRRDQLAAKGGCRKGVGLGAPRLTRRTPSMSSAIWLAGASRTSWYVACRAARSTMSRSSLLACGLVVRHGRVVGRRGCVKLILVGCADDRSSRHHGLMSSRRIRRSAGRISKLKCRRKFIPTSPSTS